MTGRPGRVVLSAALTLLVAATVGLGAPGAGANPTATTTVAGPPASPTAGGLAEAVTLAVQTSTLSARVTDLDHQIGDLSGRMSTVQVDFQLADQELTSLRIQLADDLAQLKVQAANAYMNSNLVDSAIQAPTPAAFSSASEYAKAAEGVDVQDVARLQASIAELQPIRDQKAAEAQDAQQRLAQMMKERAQDAQQLQFDQAALTQLGGVTVMGDTQLSATQLAAWYASSGRTPHLAANTTIASLAQLYVEEGTAEHVRADIAFAQSIVETDWFDQTRGNNYAGVGNCDSCHEQGYGFPTPRDGVRAQIQLLRNYADPTSRATNLAHPPSPGIYGPDPVAAAQAYDTFFLKGHVPLWNQMGNGNWATDPNYAGKVLKLYANMLAYAAANPTP